MFHLMFHNFNIWKMLKQTNFGVRLSCKPTEEGASLKERIEIWRSFFEQEQDRYRKWKLGTKGQRKRIRRETWLLLLPQGFFPVPKPTPFYTWLQNLKRVIGMVPRKGLQIEIIQNRKGHFFLTWIGKKFTTQAYICVTSKLPFLWKGNTIRKMTRMCCP
jgi:hypothetical protein